MVPVYFGISALLGKSVSDVVKVAVAGGAFHILSEVYGVNNWFLDNSVSARKRDRKRAMMMEEQRRGQYNHWNDGVPDIPGDNRYSRNPMEDIYVQNSFTTSTALPSVVQGSIYY